MRVWMDDKTVMLDRWVYLPYYLDEVELGVRACDWINGPAEDHLLEDMIAGCLV